MALSRRGYGYDYDHPSTGGYRGRIGGYRGSIGGYRGAYWGRGYDSGSGEEYRSRAQTDAGDPFGDWQSRTPIRVIRGDRHRNYDGAVWNPVRGYDHNFRHRSRDYGYGRVYRGARGYDSGGGWFW